jgi:hypothetical protein
MQLSPGAAAMARQPPASAHPWTEHPRSRLRLGPHLESASSSREASASTGRGQSGDTRHTRLLHQDLLIWLLLWKRCNHGQPGEVTGTKKKCFGGQTKLLFSSTRILAGRLDRVTRTDGQQHRVAPGITCRPVRALNKTASEKECRSPRCLCDLPRIHDVQRWRLGGVILPKVL